MANSLGDSAFCKTITALNYSQPFSSGGTSLVAPIPYSTTAATTYQAGISKYILYMQADTTGNPIATTFSVGGVPLGFAGNYTFTGTASIIVSGTTPTLNLNTPIYTTPLKVLNDTNGLTTIELNMFSSVSPVYTPVSGAVLKLIISINLD